MPRDWSHDADEAEQGHSGSGQARWLITYADLITLLLVFFIVMYALSSRVSVTNFENLKTSLSSSLKRKPQSPPPDAVPMMTDTPEKARFEAAADAIVKGVVSTDPKAQVSVDIEERGLVISLIDTSFFAPGSATLSPNALPLMAQVSRTLAGDRHALRVEGHTDATPIRSARFPSNWELSASRAAAVTRYLNTHGVTKDRLSAVGLSDAAPVASNATEDGRRRNRRVEIVVVKDAEKPRPAAAGVGAPVGAPAAVPQAPAAAATPPPPRLEGGFANPFLQRR